MKSKVTPDYWRRLRKLPNRVRRAARSAYRQFRDNPHHESLHFKKLNTKNPVWSARITRDYRAVGVFDGETIVWFWIGTHEQYDQLIRSL